MRLSSICCCAPVDDAVANLNQAYFTGDDVAIAASDDAPVDVLPTLLMSLLFIGRVDLVELLNTSGVRVKSAVVEDAARPVDDVYFSLCTCISIQG